MLRKFRVSNFKCFQNDFEFDLSETNGYSFNSQCVKNGIVNAALIYGHNGMGKSNLGLAIFDIIEHLTDQRREERRYRNYVNAYSTSPTVDFYYEFLIDNKVVKYTYKKSDYKVLVYEEFSIDDTVLVSFDRTNGNTNFSVWLKGAESLKTMINDPQLSVLKYIKNNTVLEENEQNNIFKAFFSFVEHMLFFRSLEDRTYMGLQDTGKRSLTEDIIEWGNVEDFELFLNKANISCKLSVVESLDRKDLAFDFNGKKLLMTEIMSTGTSALTLFYCWYQRIRKNEVSFLFIDEFDAFYHHDLSKMIVETLKEIGIQFILTTHNTSILSNDLLRPDCYFLMNKKKIKSLSNSTDKELREAHNIEKMYKAGAFNVD
jgi:AAA15 family ATPase/GTPase